MNWTTGAPWSRVQSRLPLVEQCLRALRAAENGVRTTMIACPPNAGGMAQAQLEMVARTGYSALLLFARHAAYNLRCAVGLVERWMAAVDRNSAGRLRAAEWG